MENKSPEDFHLSVRLDFMSDCEKVDCELPKRNLKTDITWAIAHILWESVSKDFPQEDTLCKYILLLKSNTRPVRTLLLK